MTEKLHRRGHRVPTDLQADVMANTRVEEVMSTNVVTIAAGASPAETAELVEDTGHTVLPVTDPDGQLGEIIARSDLMSDEALVASDIETLARKDDVTVTRDATVADASRLMIAEGVDHLPVVDAAGLLVGMCTRTDILKAAGTVLAAETSEEGWLSRYRRQPR
jgi:CBS domain-containing protein